MRTLCLRCWTKCLIRATRKHYSSEETITIVLDGLRGEDSIAELCRREGIAYGQSLILMRMIEHFPKV
jgi:transposase-like protein